MQEQQRRTRFSQHLPPHPSSGRFECEEINFLLGCRYTRNKKQPLKLAAPLTSRNTTLELQAYPYCYPLISLVSTTSYSASSDKGAQKLNFSRAAAGTHHAHPQLEKLLLLSGQPPWHSCSSATAARSNTFDECSRHMDLKAVRAFLPA